MAAWTLQSLIDADMTVSAHCQRSTCNHHRKLDLVRLQARLGLDAPAMHDDLVPRLKCSKCGGKAIGLIYSPSGSRSGNAMAGSSN